MTRSGSTWSFPVPCHPSEHVFYVLWSYLDLWFLRRPPLARLGAAISYVPLYSRIWRAYSRHCEHWGKHKAFSRSLPPMDEEDQVWESYQHKMTCHWLWLYHWSHWYLTCSGVDNSGVRQMDSTKLLTFLFFLGENRWLSSVQREKSYCNFLQSTVSHGSSFRFSRIIWRASFTIAKIIK
jgi:hypothetical protein